MAKDGLMLDITEDEMVPGWRPRWDYDQVLAAHGVHWVLANIPMSQINWKASVRNQARLAKPLLPATIEKYANLMKAGFIFPASVTYRYKAGGFAYADGIQRHSAAKKADRDTIGSYVLEDGLSDETIEEITKTINVFTNGEGQNPEDSLSHALSAINTNKMTFEWAVHFFQVSPGPLREAHRSFKLGERIKGTRWEVYTESFSTGAKAKLYLIHSDKVLFEMLDFAYEVQLTLDEIGQFVRELDELHNDADSIVYINTRRVRPETIARAEEIAAKRARATRATRAATQVVESHAPRRPDRIIGLDGLWRNIDSIGKILDKYKRGSVIRTRNDYEKFLTGWDSIDARVREWLDDNAKGN